MARYQYVIIGGGMTAASAVQGIRDVDPQGEIAVFSEELDPPYDRPPLSGQLWKGVSVDTIWRKLGHGLELHLGNRVRCIDLVRKTIVDSAGQSHDFAKLLLATGGRPRGIASAAPGGAILAFRTLRDYRQLKTLTNECKTFAIMGAGFIGCELAKALLETGKHVVLLTQSGTIGSRLFPEELGRHLTDYYRRKGIEVQTDTGIMGVRYVLGKPVLLFARNRRTRHEARICADVVLVTNGIRANTELARSAGLDVNDGIRVDSLLRTRHPDVYAAGDVASFPDPILRKYRRVEHADNAHMMGRLAGRNMAGAREPYHHMPFFSAKLFDLEYEAVGDTDARLKTRVFWIERTRAAMVCYFANGKICGMLFWNVPGKLDTARRLIIDMASSHHRYGLV